MNTHSPDTESVGLKSIEDAPSPTLGPSQITGEWRRWGPGDGLALRPVPRFRTIVT